MNNEYKDISEFAIGSIIQTFFGLRYKILSKSKEFCIIENIDTGVKHKASCSKNNCFKLAES